MDRKIFVVGAFGGSAPTLLRLAMDLVSHTVTIKKIDISYLLGVLIFALLGGGIAAVWKETDIKKVFYIGLGLPSLVTVVTLNGLQPGSSPAGSAPSPKAVGMFWIPSTSTVLAKNKPVPNRIVRFLVPPEAVESGLIAHFHLPDEPEIAVPVKGFDYMNVPDDASSVRLTSSVAESDFFLLSSSPGTERTVNVRAEVNNSHGFFYALGIRGRPTFKLVEELQRPGIAKIKHLVVVMMEGRSFDHMLGGLKERNHNIEGLTGNETNPDAAGTPVKVQPRARYQGLLNPDPGHTFQDAQLQMFNGAQSNSGDPNMQGFVKNYSEHGASLIRSHSAMYYFPPEKLPVLATLARRYAVCDHWFSSVPGPTFPNRAFVQTGTSGGTLDNSIFSGAGNKTIYELLAENGIQSKIYFYDQPSGSLSFLLAARHPDFFASFDQFLKDAEAETLPAYSFIEPNYTDHVGQDGLLIPANDDHPDHDVARGETFIQTVYSAIRSKPSLWESTVLVIVYSQHGGLYDHVPPPLTVNPDGKVAHGKGTEFDFTRLGVRVPAVIISPYIEAGSVDRMVYDHTSIIATARKLFLGPGWKKKYLTKRDQQANTFEQLLIRTTPRSD
jgi:phospholipase C